VGTRSGKPTNQEFAPLSIRTVNSERHTRHFDGWAGEETRYHNRWYFVMTRDSAFGWIFFLILFSVLVWWYTVQLRFYLLRYRSKRWPVVTATLQKGAVGRIASGKGGWVPAAFMGYAYVVQGARYAGYFALCGDESKIRALQTALTGGEVQVRYDPSDPNVSLLVDYVDSRFDGLTATQNPDLLNKSPAFDLQDAAR
jgi:hypothetical protein